MKKVLFFMAIAILGLTKLSYGDNGTDNHQVSVTIPSLAIMDIEYTGASKNISMALVAPTEAGLGLADATDNSIWLNYSAIKILSGTNYAVSAKLDNPIAGVDLKVQAAAAASGSVGTVGTALGQITLTSSDQPLINAIGSCYTGNGNTKGHQLTYTLTPNGSYSSIIEKTATAITVTYTIASY